MRFGDVSRILHNKKASRTTIGKGEPSRREGSNGDISIREVTGKGIFLFVKYNNNWYSRVLFDGAAEIGMQNPGREFQLFGWNPDSKAYQLIDSSEVLSIEFGSPGKLTMGSKKASSTGGGTGNKGQLILGDDTTNSAYISLGKGSAGVSTFSSGYIDEGDAGGYFRFVGGYHLDNTYRHIAHFGYPIVPALMIEWEPNSTPSDAGLLLKLKQIDTGVTVDTDTKYGSLYAQGGDDDCKLYFKNHAGTIYDLATGGGGNITVQSGNPTAITEFDTKDFIYSTSEDKLWHKVDSTTMAYESMTQVSLSFSIDDVTMTTSSGGSSEHSNVTLVGTVTNMYAKISFNNWDGTLGGAPSLAYKLTTVGLSTSTFVTSTSHMSTTDVISDTPVACAITTSEGDTSDDSSMTRNVASGEYISVTATVSEGGSSYNQTSERYYFLNGMIWGSCVATTGPTAAEFLECFTAGLNATGGKGYTLPSLSGGSFATSQYHSNFGTHQITSDGTSEYIFFGYPDQGGAVSDVSYPTGESALSDFGLVQTVGSTSTYPNAGSNGYMEVYNIYVSKNTGVSLEATVT